MKILGIDPGTATTGFGLIEKSGSILVKLDAGVIYTPKTEYMQNRLKILYDDLSQLIKTHQPDCMAVEKLFFTNNITTAMSVSQARGIALLVAAQNEIKLAEYTPLQVKMSVTGYGQAEKRQIQEMVKKILKLSVIPKPDDAADALAIAICHGASLSSGRTSWR
jgi:crossover junction endodeoxyribonuclease RuvC